MKKRIVSAVLALCLTLTLTPTSSAASGESTVAAQMLFDLGLFTGTGTDSSGNPVFSLGEMSTREQAVTMLVRLLGAEDAAKRGSWELPFTDVANWAKPYVGYAYANGLTVGISATEFGGKNTITASQYLTFVLRALGYDSGTDFKWNAAWELSDRLGITNGEYNENTKTFLRGDMAIISASALNATLKDKEMTLLEQVKLVKAVDIGGSYSWRFEMNLDNKTDSALVLEKLTIVKRIDGESGRIISEHVFTGSELPDIDLGSQGAPLTLTPGDQFIWSDGHPVDNRFDFMGYTFTFRDESGKMIDMVFSYPLSHELPGGIQFGISPEDDDGRFVPIDNNGEYAWRFKMSFKNTTNSMLTLETLTIIKRAGDTLFETFTAQSDQLPGIGLGIDNAPLTLNPGKQFSWYDGHPIADYFDFMGYTFTFRDESGKKIDIAFSYPLSHELPPKVYPSYADDQGRDLNTLRYDASYCVEVSDGVYWVPARTLGNSDYTNAQIQAMLTDSPEAKQEKIDTLYEALQLYQIGAFSMSNDNIRIREGIVDWEHHKPGYHAVRTNTGCCATDSNWLRYILDGDYDEIGYLATSQRDGGGHIYNYIKQDGWYYFIDLTHYCVEWDVTALESGNMDDYYRSDYILGNIHKVKDIQDYVAYVQSDFSDPPGLMFFYTAENCLAVDGVHSGDTVTITYENTADVQVVFDDPTDKLEYAFVAAPQNYPDWSQEKSFDFSVIG